MEKKKKYLDYPYLVIAFLFIYAGSNTLFTQVILSTQYSAYVVLATSIVIYLLNCRRGAMLPAKSLRFVCLLILSLIFTLALNVDFDNFNGYLLIIMKIIGALFLLQVLDLRRFFKAYSDVILIISVASLIVTYVLPISLVAQLFPTIANSHGVQFFNGFLAYRIDSYGTYAIRNYGIFSEPAVFGFYLFLGVLFSFFRKKQITLVESIKISVLCISMVTTFSPIGLLSAIVLYLYLIWRIYREKSTLIVKTVPFLCLIVVLGIFLFNQELNSGILFSLSKATIETGNGLGRVNAILENLDVWLHRPIFGGGLKNSTDVAATLGLNTSTTAALLSNFGMLMLLSVSIAQFSSIRYILNGENTFIQILFFVLFLLEINNHGFIQADWFWLFTMIGVVKKRDSFDTAMQSGKYRM